MWNNAHDIHLTIQKDVALHSYHSHIILYYTPVIISAFSGKDRTHSPACALNNSLEEYVIIFERFSDHNQKLLLNELHEYYLQQKHIK